jgi:hypothetical protein
MCSPQPGCTSPHLPAAPAAAPAAAPPLAPPPAAAGVVAVIVLRLVQLHTLGVADRNAVATCGAGHWLVCRGARQRVALGVPHDARARGVLVGGRAPLPAARVLVPGVARPHA